MSNYLYSIQILRAIACISVVYFHTTAKFGSFGLDIFFIISGFVITMIINKGTKPKIFILTRISRIVPLYWILTTFLLFLTILTPELLNSTTFNLNYYFKSIFFIPYYNQNNILEPMLIQGWTLNYEIFFYLCAFISIIISRKKILITTLVFFVSFFLYFKYFFLESSSALKFFFSTTLIFEFLLGVIAFYIFKFYQNIKIIPIIPIVAAIVSYIIMIYYEAETKELDKDLRIYFYGFPSLVLVLSLCFLEKFFTNNNCIKILLNIGHASYSIYLSHIFIIGFLKITNAKFNFFIFPDLINHLFTIFICLILGRLVYIFIDKPINYILKKKLYKF
jgi:exopolysaccharide production protein ExoZ